MSSEIEKLFRLSLDLLCIAGTDGRFRRLNPAFERTLGWSREELLENPFFHFVHPDDVEATIAEVQKLAEGIPTVSFENRYRCRDGSYKVLRWTAHPEPETGSIYAAAHDVTELRAAKDRAEAADRAKSVFLANMSHEVLTPMNGILGMVEVALASASDPQARHYLEVIRQSADALLALLEDVLDVTKVEAGKIALHPVETGLRDLVGDTMKALAMPAHRKGVEILCRIDPRVPDRVVTDPVRLRQVIINVVGNGIKFTERGYVRVDVTSEPEEGDGCRLHFEVTDTGIGIPVDKQEEIFESFGQADPSASRRFGGSGLGLAISRHLVELLGGRLEVSSEPTQGSTFRFDVAVIRRAGAGGVTVPTALTRKRVLLVEDDSVLRGLLSEILGRWRIACVAVGTREEAKVELDLVGEDDDRRFDLVLLDRQLGPDGNFGWVEELRRECPWAGVILMLPTSDAPHDIRRTTDLGLDAYLIKPFKDSELLAALLRAAGLEDPSRKRQEIERSHPLRVLLAEDNRLNQEVVSGLLATGGHVVDIAGDGREAVRRAAAGGYDLILMDVQMPEMDGLEATAVIRAAEAEAGSERVPIVAMTAHADRGARRRCLAAGMDDHLAKPLRAHELYAVLARVRRGTASVGTCSIPPGDAHFDAGRALRAVNGDLDLLRRVAETAAREVPELLGQIATAACSSDLDCLCRVTHRLKGTVGLFSTGEVLGELDRLEASSRDGEMEEALDLSSKIAKSIEGTLAGVRGILESSRAGSPAESTRVAGTVEG